MAAWCLVGTEYGLATAGIGGIFAYCNNDDPVHQSKNCAHAAAATLLVAKGRLPQQRNGFAQMTTLYSHYPPDLFGGAAGTSRARMIAMLLGNGLMPGALVGLNGLKVWIAAKRPVAVVLDTAPDRAGSVGTPGLFGRPPDAPGGHWVTAFAYNDGGVFISNWYTRDPGEVGYIPWDKFQLGWSSWIADAIGMKERGLVAI